MWPMIPFVVLALTLSVTTPGQTSGEDDWPMYGRNLQHTFSNPSSAITPENVSTLQQAWSFPTGDVVSASPTVVGGVVYVGAWDGFLLRPRRPHRQAHLAIPSRLPEHRGSVRRSAATEQRRKAHQEADRLH
jgi:hypothetical protein